MNSYIYKPILLFGDVDIIASFHFIFSLFLFIDNVDAMQETKLQPNDW